VTECKKNENNCGQRRGVWQYPGMSKTHTYTIPAEFLTNFRTLTATEDVASKILGRIAYDSGYVIADEVSYQNGEQFLSVWHDDSEDSDEEDAVCKIVRKPA